MKAPVKGYKNELYPKGDVTQWFGENPALYARFDINGHPGIDIVRPHGEPLMAVESGIIVDVKNSPDGYGKHLRFISDERTSGRYSEWTYGHCRDIYVSIGDHVEAGQIIAAMGNTGFVVSGNTPFWKNNPYAGTHLHLGRREVRRTSSGWNYPGSDIKITVYNYKNGFKGNVDFKDMLDHLDPELVDESETIKTLQLTVISLLRTLLGLLKAKQLK
jgi:murein DD-endopeptidase MepM/ murein hydrolase activator NlpD